MFLLLLSCPRKEALDSLPDQLNSARSFDERLK